MSRAERTVAERPPAGMPIGVESVFREEKRLCEEVSANVGMENKTRALALYALAGSSLYGLTMGLSHSPAQALSSAVKVPALFLLTLLICLPTLHFIGLLFGSRIGLVQSVVVLLGGIAITSILLAAFAPIALLFLASGSSYSFLLLMHVSIFAFCGGAGLCSVLRNYRYLRQRAKAEAEPLASDQVMKVWAFLYMFVGTQTAYVLAPFIERETAFKLFGKSEGNFYTYLWSVIVEVMRSSGTL